MSDFKYLTKVQINTNSKADPLYRHTVELSNGENVEITEESLEHDKIFSYYNFNGMRIPQSNSFYNTAIPHIRRMLLAIELAKFVDETKNKGADNSYLQS